jgi:hypothetical protein
VEELLAPHEAGGGLPDHGGLLGRRAGRDDLLVELVGLGPPARHDVVELVVQRRGQVAVAGHVGVGQRQP